ncbi:MAG: hypothetical protein PWQ77_1660 [Kosmotogales bacterium]|nr:hypothetical protein [Kosmotogales bacterium]
MTKDEKYVIRIMFKLRIHKKNGQEFEDFFCDIMEKYNNNFHPVKAHGKIGDKKNDGFDKVTGTYYQVHAPENINKRETIYESASKLKRDFTGLLEFWNATCPIKKFFYVVNDKYSGNPPLIHKAIIELNKKYPNIEIDEFRAKDLEDIFFKLDEDDIIDIVGNPPDINIDKLNFSELNEVIEYLINMEVTAPDKESLIAPNFDKKIKINNLCDIFKNYLNIGSYNIGDLEKYFKNNSHSYKQTLRDKFNSIYNDSKKEIPETDENFSDIRFQYILEKVLLNKKKAVFDATIILMSYFFESCDIFEYPTRR